MTSNSDIKSPKLRKLHTYWESMKQGDIVPLRSRIEPIGIGAQMLPYVMLVEVVDEGHDFYYRLVGSAVARAAGGDFKGMTLSAHSQEGVGMDVKKGYLESLESQDAVYDFGDFRDVGRSFTFYERLILPMSLTGEKVDIFLVGLDINKDEFSFSE